MNTQHILRVAQRVANMPTKEGEYAAPDGQVIAHLQKFLSDKYAIDVAYRNFSDRIRGPLRQGLAEHFYEHADEERKNAYELNMKVIALGADPIQTQISVPACTPNISAFVQVLMQMELDAIEAGRELARLAGDNLGLKVLAENTVLLDSHHLDDLRRWADKAKA
jgi:bacterioferritin (cytochrome b1)